MRDYTVQLAGRKTVVSLVLGSILMSSVEHCHDTNVLDFKDRIIHMKSLPPKPPNGL